MILYYTISKSGDATAAIKSRAPRLVLVLAVFLGLLAPDVYGQSRTTAALTGQIMDEVGNKLTGVTVQITSPGLIGGIRTVKTDHQGMFRFSELPPGIYTVLTSFTGFKTVQMEAIRLFVARTAEVRIRMPIYAGEADVVVHGKSIGTDPTSSSSPWILDGKFLENIPTDRDTSHILNLAPAVNIESAYGGAAESGNSYQMDGVDISDPQGGAPWSFFNYSLIDEVQLIGLGAPAEYGQFTGAIINTITKSGGNQFSGSAEFFFTNKALTASDSKFAGLSSTIEKHLESTFQIGGALKKDKLWYFVSGQYLHNKSSEGGPIETEKDPRLFFKLTWNANENGTLSGWVERDHTRSTGRDGDAFTPLESTTGEDNPEWVGNVSWNSILSEHSILTIAWGGYSGERRHKPHNGFALPGHVDAQTGIASVNAAQFDFVNRNRNQLNVAISHHATDWISGYHDFKLGAEMERSLVRDRSGYPGGAFFSDNEGPEEDPSTGRDDFFTLAFFGGGYDASGTNSRVSMFIQDSWRLTSRFTLNPGVRLDINRGRVPGATVFRTNPISPRIGFAWDLTGEGETVVRGHYGRYSEALYASFYYYLDPGAFYPQTIERIFNRSGFQETITKTLGQRYAIDPDIRQPYLDQYVLGFDRQLPFKVMLTGTLVYRRNADLIETISRDGQFVPVHGKVPGTGEEITLFDYVNPGTDVLIYTNPPGLNRSYKGLILSAARHFLKNWQLQASYVYSRSRGNTDNLGFDEIGIGGNTPFFDGHFLDTPNSLVHARGRLTHDQTHQIKLQGTWVVPFLPLSISTNYTFHSGDTWTPRSDCLLTDDGNGVMGDGIHDCHEFPQGPVLYFAEPRGSKRLHARNELDLHVEWQHDMGENQNLSFIVDIFNLNNQRRATEVETEAAESLGEPATFNFPRNARLGIGFSW